VFVNRPYDISCGEQDSAFHEPRIGHGRDAVNPRRSALEGGNVRYTLRLLRTLERVNVRLSLLHDCWQYASFAWES
jgi:hypothetical protein